MPAMDQLAASVVKHVLVYGPPKVGKTLLAGGLAEEMNLIWLDIEFGSDTLFQLPKEWQSRINLFRIPDSKKFPIAAETIMKLLSVGKGTICRDHGKFNCPACGKDRDPKNKLLGTVGTLDPIDLTCLGPKDVVVIDSWSQIVMSILGNLLRNKPDDYKMERDDWGNLKNAVENLGTMVQGAPFNIVVISHEEEAEMVDKTSKIVPVGGSRNTSRNFAKYFGEVVYAEIENKKHKFSSSSTAKMKVVTGSRSGTEMEKSATPRLLDIFKHQTQVS